MASSRLKTLLLMTVVQLLISLPLIEAIDRPRGVSLEKAQFYQGGTEFKCLSDGKTIPMEHVNDDFCDCEDGSDEPGTSACDNGLFYCENKPYTGNYIMSSRVNDGICDCCDGSDEYDGTISCDNTCEQLFSAIMAAKEAFRVKQLAGYQVKLDYIQQGKRAKDEKLVRLSELEKSKDTLQQEKNEAEEFKNNVEKPETEAKDMHEAAWNALKESKKKASDAEKAKAAFAELDANHDGIVDYPEIQNHLEFDIDSDGSVSYEEAKEYLEDSEECVQETFVEKIWQNIKEIYKPPVPPTELPPSSDPAEAVPVTPEEVESVDESIDEPIEEPVEGGTDFEDEEEDDEDDDFNDRDDEYDTLPNTKEEVDENKMPEYDEETKKLIAVADVARNRFNEADKKVKDVDREINDIKKYLELDLGSQEEFSALKGQCFEYSDREYTYTLCPFDKTTQRSIKAGGMETSLGRWGKWFGPDDNKFAAMKYENGQGCWNGPARSCHVNMHCGEVNALTAASEPSRCEYQFEFTTPALCDSPEKEQSFHGHEEL